MITIVAAIGRNGAIGKGGMLPWRFPEDMAHFKALTMGHAVIMGRKTWDSIPAKFRPLPGRTSVVLTRGEWRNVEEGGIVCRSLDAAVPLCRLNGHEHTDIIGGAEVYAAALSYADRLEVTEVDVEVEGADAFFPFDDLFAPHGSMNWAPECTVPTGETFRCVARRKGKSPELTFVTWERVV